MQFVPFNKHTNISPKWGIHQILYFLRCQWMSPSFALIFQAKRKYQPSSWTPCFRQNKIPRFRQSGGCRQGCILSFLISTLSHSKGGKTDWNIFPAAGDNGGIIFCHFSSRLALLSCKLLLAGDFHWFLSLSLSLFLIYTPRWHSMSNDALCELQSIQAVPFFGANCRKDIVSRMWQ